MAIIDVEIDIESWMRRRLLGSSVGPGCVDPYLSLSEPRLDLHKPPPLTLDYIGHIGLSLAIYLCELRIRVLCGGGAHELCLGLEPVNSHLTVVSLVLELD